MVKTIMKTLGVCAVALAVVCGITGCSSGKNGVAVTINGDKILEEAITKKSGANTRTLRAYRYQCMGSLAGEK